MTISMYILDKPLKVSRVCKQRCTHNDLGMKSSEKVIETTLIDIVLMALSSLGMK